MAERRRIAGIRARTKKLDDANFDEEILDEKVRAC